MENKNFKELFQNRDQTEVRPILKETLINFPQI
jgi:hypothetical protein